MTGIFTRPAQGLWTRLVAIAESRPGSQDIRALSAMTDEELAARGTTRQNEMRRILGARYYY